MTTPVVTRFAPSPTGFLHIGGARTALFCWLYARHHGGQYLLRIEDTDRERSTDAAMEAIVDGLDWLGLMPDGDIVYQSKNQDRHTDVARQLLESGNAYYCYCSKEELAAMREKAREEGRLEARQLGAVARLVAEEGEVAVVAAVVVVVCEIAVAAGLIVPRPPIKA